MYKSSRQIEDVSNANQRQWAVGEYGKLNLSERKEFYIACCKTFCVSASFKPFDVINFKGREILYPNSACIRQLAVINNLTTTIVQEGKTKELYKVTVEVKSENGRATQEYAVVSISGCEGERLANLMMKCLTKAKRRAVLSHCGMPSVI